ncbi:general amino acid permease 1 [Russula earlei]|uniref:General amino acid permease 1 n=1 Tax=Russula earlei TaxID=71964 RepID=A0ACC0UBK1_9AGAM|nr:general amino acid permease 1 [Russula earlei]
MGVKDFQLSDKSSSDGASGASAKFYNADLDKVQRKLSGFHVQMFAIAGVIGTGLFLGLGQLLSTTGPLGVLLVFSLVGSVAFAFVSSSVPDSHPDFKRCTLQLDSVCNGNDYLCSNIWIIFPLRFTSGVSAGRWVDPALGFAVGWVRRVRASLAPKVLILALPNSKNYFYSSHVPIYVAIFIVAAYTGNILGPRFFGHTEVVFATLKLMLVIGLIIGGLVISLGGGPDHTRHGFQYWVHPGPLVSSLEPGALGRFLGLLLGIIYAAFAMCGIEILTLSSLVWLLGCSSHPTDPELFKKTGNAGQSPFVLVFNRAGVKTLPHIVNAVVLTSAFSSANGMLYSASRLLFALGVQGQAPRIVTTGLFSFLAFLNTSNGLGKVFHWFLNLNYGLKAQGGERSGYYVGYRSIFQPYAGMYVVFWTVIFILVSGISVFWHFNVTDFLAAYIDILIFAMLYIGWKVVGRTKIVPLLQMDFETGIPSFEETEGTEPSGYHK